MATAKATKPIPPAPVWLAHADALRLAAEHGLRRAALTDAIREGHIGCRKAGGRKYLIESEFLKWLAAPGENVAPSWEAVPRVY